MHNFYALIKKKEKNFGGFISFLNREEIKQEHVAEERRMQIGLSEA